MIQVQPQQVTQQQPQMIQVQPQQVTQQQPQQIQLQPMLFSPVQQPQQQQQVFNQVEVSKTAGIVMDLVAKLKNNFDHYTLNENNLVDYCVRIMSLIDADKTLSGFEKKAVVIEVLTKLVDLTPGLPEEGRNALKQVIKIVVPGLIESLIAASKGLISINKKVIEVTKKCCFCF